MKKAQAGTIIAVLIISFILVAILLPIIFMNSLFIETTRNGHHTGTVTAVETNGVIFKTNAVYFKSDSQSSQEDSYCVIDPLVKEKLEQSAKTKRTITIIYKDYLFIGVNKCGLVGNGIIIGVE